MGFDKAKLAANALTDFTTATGLGGHTGTHDPLYTNYTDVNAVTCIGGDPSKCNKEGLQGGAWADSTATAPRLLHYKLLAQSELLNDMDPDIKKTLEDATSMYIQQKQKGWDTVDKCPKSCNGRGNCTKGGDKCDCSGGCTVGRMCSVTPGPAVPVCAGITWGNGGCDHKATGKLATGLKPGDSVKAGTWPGCSLNGDITITCSRQAGGQLVAKFSANGPFGGDPGYGPPVASGCSAAKNIHGDAWASCCWPK
jgi:hypothetical protein